MSETPSSPPTAAGFDTVRVDLGARAYDIQIGRGLLQRAGLFLAPLFAEGRRRRVAIVTDRSVGWRWLEPLWAGLASAGVDADAITLEPGERTKSFAELERLLDQLLAARIERGDLVIALGGGVIGDLTGFAAAVLRRGVRYVQIPTSLLAQVDSSVGGKTGINTGQGKNLVGAIHQPSLVLIDVDVLDTLPERELKAGYAEVVKYGLLGDAAFFSWLEAHGGAVLAGDADARIHAVKTSCAAKARIVERDETEQGDRALLNLGHTFGHALEAATGYGPRLIHGEAVSIGMGLAFDLSARLGHCAQEEPSRVRAHLAGLGLKTGLDEIAGELPDADGLMALMAQDKKVSDGVATFILARGIGDAFRSRDAPPEAVRTLLADALAARG